MAPVQFYMFALFFISAVTALTVPASSYIVVLKDGASDADLDSVAAQINLVQPSRRRRQTTSSQGGVKYKYSMDEFKALSCEANAATLATIKVHPAVAYVEKDQVFKMATLVTQPNAVNWGLGRISHKKPGNYDYIYDSSAGTGTFGYIVDTGIRITHQDFGGRAYYGANFVPGSPDTDEYGHGTHVAGIFGSTTYGVAKNTTLISVKVGDYQGQTTTTRIMAGVNWAFNDTKVNGRKNMAVINLSVAVAANSPSLDAAVDKAANKGIFVSIGAGNDNTDANYTSPANAPAGCTVGATTINDTKASFSNYGAIVDLFAPGDNITSTYAQNDTATIVASGTSQAAPFVGGIGAYLMALDGIKAEKLCAKIQNLAVSTQPDGAYGPNTTTLIAQNGVHA